MNKEKDKEVRQRIIAAGYVAVEQLVRVAKEDILKPVDDESPSLAADRLKNAAATKRLAIFDAFEILKRIEEEQNALSESGVPDKVITKQGFAERRSK